MSRTYFNTNQLTGKDLEKATKKAQTQEEIVLKIFQQAPKDLTAVDVLYIWRKKANKLGRHPALLTSVRRACSTLAAANHIRKTNKKRIGPHGSPIHYYQLMNRQNEPI